MNVKLMRRSFTDGDEAAAVDINEALLGNSDWGRIPTALCTDRSAFLLAIRNMSSADVRTYSVRFRAYRYE
jgi:hypothetical protein